MNNLINMLMKLEEDSTIEESAILDPNNSLVHDISCEAEALLITNEGYCNWDNIEKLKSYGYQVFPLERDSFGWLTGGISTTKGVIAYG